jgi:hypothetical protein
MPDNPDNNVTDLLRRSAISFTGTVERLGASSVPELTTVDDHTAIVLVERVLHAPPSFTHLAGTQITVQLEAGTDPPPVGQRLAFFANGLAFGAGLAVTEVGRLPVSEVEPYIESADAANAPAPFSDLQRGLKAEQLREHAAGAAAVVVGTVVNLRRAGRRRVSEHDPDYWIATLNVRQVEQGDVSPGEIEVVYPNSRDVRWHDKPKPAAGQNGVWILHPTEGATAELGQYQLADADDYQPVQSLDSLRTDAEPTS